MKKLILSFLLILSCGFVSSQYFYFDTGGIQTYRQGCSGELSIKVYSNGLNIAQGGVRLQLDNENTEYYSGNDISNLRHKMAVIGDAFEMWSSDQYPSWYENDLVIDVKSDHSYYSANDGEAVSLKFVPKYGKSEFVYKIDYNDSLRTILFRQPNVLMDYAQQAQHAVFTGTIYQKPCEDDTTPPQKPTITKANGDVMDGQIKVKISDGLQIKLVEGVGVAGDSVPYVFTGNNKRVDNDWNIDNQMGINIDASTITIKRGLNEKTLKLSTVCEEFLEKNGYTWEYNDRNYVCTIPGDRLAERIKIDNYNDEQLVTITVNVKDRAETPNSNSSTITFNAKDDPVTTLETPSNNAVNVNLTEMVRGTLVDNWAGISGDSVVVVLSGGNAATSGYYFVASGLDLNLSGFAGGNDNDAGIVNDYYFTISGTTHPEFPASGKIYVKIYGEDMLGNGNGYVNSGSTPLSTYSFNVRPSCLEMQCCDDDIHIYYENADGRTGIKYNASTLTIVGGSGSLSDYSFFHVMGSTGYLDCGVSVAGLTFHSRKITSTRAGENGFTDTGTIIGSGNGTFIVQSGDDLIIGFMKDYVSLSDVNPDPTNYITDVNSINIGWKLVGSREFGDLLGVNGQDVNLGDGWLKKYVVSVEIPARMDDGDYAIEYVAEFDTLPDPYDFNLSDLGGLSNLVYTTHLCASGLSWNFGTDSCVPSLDPVCKENEVIANGKCVCSVGMAHNREGICQDISELNDVCISESNGDKPRWNENTRECVDNNDYCGLFGGHRNEGEGTCDEMTQSLTQEGGYIHCQGANQLFVDGDCVTFRESCGSDKYYIGNSCVEIDSLPSDGMSAYCESFGATVDNNSFECVCASGKRMVAGAGCIDENSAINTDRGELSSFNLQSYFEIGEGDMLDGTYTGNVRVVDIEGRVSDPLIFTFMIDTTPPTCIISASEPYMCSGDTRTLTISSDDANYTFSFDGYTSMLPSVSLGNSEYGITGNVTNWGSFTGYVMDLAGNTGRCVTGIVNPKASISGYTVQGVNTGTVTVTGLFEKMNISENRDGEGGDCGTGGISLSIVSCENGLTGSINGETFTAIPNTGLEGSTLFCIIEAIDQENEAQRGNLTFTFDTLAPGCTLSVGNEICEDIVNLDEMANCGDGQEYNESLGICMEPCDGTLHSTEGGYICCVEDMFFNGVSCVHEDELECHNGIIITTAEGIDVCVNSDQLELGELGGNLSCDGGELDDINSIAECNDLSCPEGFVWVKDGEDKYSCVKLDEYKQCNEPKVWNGSYCAECHDGMIYVTADMVDYIQAHQDEYPELVDQIDKFGCFPYELFVNCHDAEGEICYGSNLPVVVAMLDEHGNVSTYRWEGPFGLISAGNTTGVFGNLYVSNVGVYKMQVSDEYGNTSSCDIELSGDRLDLVAPVVTATNITGYECHTITGSVSVTDDGCASGWTYQWFNELENLNVLVQQLGLTQNITGSQVRDVVVTDAVGNAAGAVSVNYQWFDLPLYINTGSHDLGMLLPEFENNNLVPSTGIDVLDLFDAQEMSGTVTCGDDSNVTLDSISCDASEWNYDGTFVTGTIDDVTGSIVNIYVGEYASVGNVSCTGTISDDDGNSTGYELTLEVGREGLIIGTPDSLQGTITPGESISIKGFWVQDKRGSDTGYYTTIQSRGLRNTSNGNVVPVTLISHLGNTDGLYVLGTPNATMINSAMWEANGGVEFGAESDPVLYFYRQDGANGGAKNLYSDELILSVGDDIAGGTYTGEIVFTLYDRSFTMGNDEGDGVYWNEGQGLISVVKNGQTQYTLQDKNLGASVAGTGEESYGKYYQWGNNLGFSTGDVVLYAVTYDPSLHTPTHAPWSVDWFLIGQSVYSTSSELIQSLWGVPQGGDIASGLLNQGPCDEEYHVPTYSQWTGLIAVLNTTQSNDLNNLLNLPFAGSYSYDNAELQFTGSQGVYWAADWHNQSAVNLTIREGNNWVIYDMAPQFQGNSMRCFKNTVVNPVGEGWVKTSSL